MCKLSKENFLEGLLGADNVYLTNEYLVIQNLSLVSGAQTFSQYLVSYDFYYTLNKARLKVYSGLFKAKKDFSVGKRIKTACYIRSYIE